MRVDDKADSCSPDGKQIMYIRDNGPTASLWTMSAGGTDPHQLTRGLAVHGGSWGTHP